MCIGLCLCHICPSPISQRSRTAEPKVKEEGNTLYLSWGNSKVAWAEGVVQPGALM